MKISRSFRIGLANAWPPFIGMGIRLRMGADGLSIGSVMRLRFWNRNIVGTQFGGGLYAMVDPLYMILLLENLGPDYIVWDKAATIRFKRPGRGDVFAHCALTRAQIDEIRRAADTQDKVEPQFTVQITDAGGAVVAEVDKLLSVRHKRNVPAGRR